MRRADTARNGGEEARLLRPCGRTRYLFWKVYLHGLILVILAGAAIAVIEVGLGHPEGVPWHEFEIDVSRYLSGNYNELVSHPAELERNLRCELDIHAMEVSLYGITGALIATNVHPPLAPLSSSDLDRLDGKLFHPTGQHRTGWGEETLASRLPLEGPAAGYVVMHQRRDGAPLALRISMTVVVVLLVLGIGSLPIARFITAPVERLTAAARLIGNGDLSVRTGISRRRDEVGHLAMAFDEMADRLERLVQSERELLANISHELRTPLSRIRVAAEIAAEGDSERAKLYLSEITIDLNELDRLIEDVLTLARLDVAEAKGSQRTLPLRRERIDACGLVEQAAGRFQAAHPEVTLNVEIAPALPALEADPALLQRAISNLLDNAHKYSDPGEPIILRGSASDGCLTVEVQDRGIGIEAEDVPRLFEPFFRTDRSRSRQAGGVGLGLALVRRIVTAHKGDISVDSTPGKGTTFRIRIPAVSSTVLGDFPLYDR